MSDHKSRDSRTYETNEVSGSAFAIFGDVNDHGTRYNVQHHHYNYYGSTSYLSPQKALTDKPHDEYGKSTGRGLALLAFDGGVYGGLTNLFVLKRFMERVAELQGLRIVPKPCEFFDMIGGAGVGGLLAILLGSLELTIDQCIERYLRFSDSVLRSPSIIYNESASPELDCSSTIFDQLAVERFVKQSLRSCAESEERLLQASSAISCKVFVKAAAPDEHNPYILRSYQSQGSEDNRLAHVKLWQAAQATLASSALFHPITITDENYRTIYGSSTDFEHGTCRTIWDEAQASLLDHGQALVDHLDCLVSIGNHVGMTIIPECQSSTSTDTFMSSILAMTNSADEEFAKLRSSTSISGQLCRLQIPVELRRDQAGLKEESARSSLTAEDFLNNDQSGDHLHACLHRLLRHQLAPGFAMIRGPEQHLKSSSQSRKLPQPEQISSYDARIAHFRRSQPRVKHTCTWIFTHPAFIDWAQSIGSATLICTGTVGCGKSILAAAIIDNLLELRLDTHQRCIHYFFETGHNSASSLDNLYRAVIKQLMLQYDSSIVGMPIDCSIAIKSVFGSSGVPPATEDLVDLLKLLIDAYPPSLYLIDGFDDLNELQIQDMFGALRRIFAANTQHGSKLVLISREILGRGINVEDQLTGLSQIYSVRLELFHLQADIDKFVEAQVKEQQLRRVITKDESLIKDIKKSLKANSDKMFLWIYFQIRTIWDPKLSKTDAQIRALIENLPDGLEETYERCLRRIEDQDPDHRNIAERAFRWVSAVETPLTPRQAREVVSIDQSNISLRESDVLNASVTEFCANLLTTDLTNRQVLFVHASVKRFLLQRSKIAPDLMRYHLDPVEVNSECAAVCLAYLDTVRSRKQLVVRQGADVTKLLPKMIEDSLPSAFKKLPFARAFIRSSSRVDHIPRSAATSQSSFNTTRLEVHDYFLCNWPSLTSNMNSFGPNRTILERLCRDIDQEIFHWVRHTGNEVSAYQQIAQYGVVNRHLPLLQAVHRCIKTHKSKLLSSVFESNCPGTNVRLVHMAAALGYTDVLQVLAQFCEIDVHDHEPEPKTAVAWAAEKSHFDTVDWLVAKGVSVVACRYAAERSQPYSKHKVSLMTILAGLDTDDGFFRFFGIHDHYTNPTIPKADLPAAFLTACKKGHVSIGTRLMLLGGPLNDPASFYWSGTGKYHHNMSVIDVATENEDMRVLETLVAVIQTSRDDEITNNMYAYYMARICKGILSPHVQRSLAECNMASAPNTTHLLLMVASCYPYPRDQSNFAESFDLLAIRLLSATSFLRKLVLAQASHWGDCSKLLQSLTLRESQVWNLIPDDIMLLVLRLGHVKKCRPLMQETSEAAMARRLLARRSSRLLLALASLSQGLSELYLFHWTTLEEFFSESPDILNDATMEAILYQLLTRRGERVTLEAFETFERRFYSRSVSWADPHAHPEVFKWFRRILSMQNTQSIEAIFHLARCYRTQKGHKRRAERMYEDLKDIPDNYDLSLNFPFGYMQINGRYVIKVSIVLAIYRWNYRLRRRYRRPFSTADTAYANTVGIPIPVYGHEVYGSPHSSMSSLDEARGARRGIPPFRVRVLDN